MKNKKNDDLTILCPIKDRVEFTQRFVDYSIKNRCPFRIIISDGSCDSKSEDALKKVDYQDIEIEYIRCHHDKDWAAYLRKMCESLSLIQTTYTVLACDDDYLDYEALLIGVRFLKENKLYSSFAAEVVDFDVFGGYGDGIYGDIYISDNKRHCSGRYRTDQVVDGDNISERLVRYADIWPYEYIHKTDTLKLIFQFAADLEINNYHHLIMIMRYITLIEGKVYFDDSISFLLRQDNTFNSQGDEMIRENLTYLHFLANEDNMRKQEMILGKLKTYICNNYINNSFDLECIFQGNLAKHYRDVIKVGVEKNAKITRLDYKIKSVLYIISVKTRVFYLYRRLRVIYLGLIKYDKISDIPTLNLTFLKSVQSSIRNNNSR